ncbi:MAG: molybdenum cofactor guanylyltransferase [Mycobacteriales bacterium]
MAEPYDAVVLAGGSARRLGGADKPALLVGEVSLLDRVVLAVADAATVTCVGPERPTARAVTWVREEPPGGGPVAALAAGLPYVTADQVALLAADLPFLDAATIRLLRDAATADGAVLTDADGRDQLLVGVWRTDALRDALPAEPSGARLGHVLAALDAARVFVPTAPGTLPTWFDCDTADDLTTARGNA